MTDSPTPEGERGPRRVYANDAIEVLWEPTFCIHARSCVRGLAQVFDPTRRPWIDLGGADPDAVVETILTCPTGALHFRRLDAGAAEAAPEPTTVDVCPNGPLFVHGDIRIEDREGNVIRHDTRVALCRCGGSSNKPFCDGTHQRNGFRG